MRLFSTTYPTNCGCSGCTTQGVSVSELQAVSISGSNVALASSGATVTVSSYYDDAGTCGCYSQAQAAVVHAAEPLRIIDSNPATYWAGRGSVGGCVYCPCDPEPFLQVNFAISQVITSVSVLGFTRGTNYGFTIALLDSAGNAVSSTPFSSISGAGSATATWTVPQPAGCVAPTQTAVSATPSLSVTSTTTATAMVTPTPTAAASAAAAYSSGSIAFATACSLSSFVVPTGVTSMSVSLWGAGGDGWSGWPYQNGAGGAYVSGVLATTPGDVLYIVVGGHGAGLACGHRSGDSGDIVGWAGGFSAIYRGSAVSEPLVLAGGAGRGIFDHAWGQAHGRAVPTTGSLCAPGSMAPDSASITSSMFGSGWSNTPAETSLLVDAGAGVGGLSCANGLRRS